ncbi:protein JASON-like [Vigna unguiculata]|uniref:protein JASON-like n=1 Tax=Vigna unguiculata TaxID=3917 RepID=UPI001015CBB5|nr:protein JASON-like [Vigna unguiculata]
MGCFFACFRARDSAAATTTTVPSSLSGKHKPDDVAVSRNQLSTLFLCEEREDSVVRDDVRDFEVRSQKGDNEAKFLKAGARIPFEKVHHESRPFNPSTPVKCCEEGEKRTSYFEQTPSSCISNAQSSQCTSLDSTGGIRTGSLHSLDKNENTASVSPWPSTTYTKRNKSVRFECGADLSSCDLSDSTNNESAYKPSLYPTPMKLSDEMQTPGTVYPTTKEDLPNVRPRLKSQFVYPINNPEDEVSQKILEEDGHTQDSVERSDITTSTPDKGLKKISCEDECKVESLSSWLKPAAVILEERNRRMQIAYNHVRKTPVDRPIIGMVAAHWNENEDSQAPPPKWWDGNGIPNSTNKYKEDQKVNWHATPFEERLEKALSEESVITQRKDACGKSMPFDENEESDTALSQLQSSTHPQSVVSF